MDLFRAYTELKSKNDCSQNIWKKAQEALRTPNASRRQNFHFLVEPVYTALS